MGVVAGASIGPVTRLALLLRGRHRVFNPNTDVPVSFNSIVYISSLNWIIVIW